MPGSMVTPAIIICCSSDECACDGLYCCMCCLWSFLIELKDKMNHKFKLIRQENEKIAEVS